MKKNITKQRVALVTGGGQGIGRGIALHLAANGCTVVIFDLDAEAAIETAHEANGRIVPLVGDVSNEAAVADLLAQIHRDFGRLDGLVNNAGIAGPFTGPLEELRLADWNRVLAVNLTGAFLLAKHAAPLLRRSGGAIVNIASPGPCSPRPAPKPTRRARAAWSPSPTPWPSAWARRCGSTA